MNNTYMVSVRLMVYNHELYIREAMEGILKQKTNFLVEVVIGDDFSTDKSLEIIKEYKSTDTIHIKILDRKKGDDYWNERQRLGRLYNFYNIIENCSGKYIALLDGDDYWTDPYKLQKQVDFLETNPDFSICFHKVEILRNEIKKRKDFSNEDEKSTLSIHDLALKGNPIHTPSVVFKKQTEYPNWLMELAIADYPFHMFNAQFGKIKFMDEVMGVYRIHESGVWGSFSKEKLYERWIPLLDVLETKFDSEVNKFLRIQKKHTLLDLYRITFYNKDIEKANFAISKLQECDAFFIAKKMNEIERRLENKENSNAYKIGNRIIKILGFSMVMGRKK